MNEEDEPEEIDEYEGEEVTDIAPSQDRVSLAAVYENMAAAGLGGYFSLVFPNVDVRTFAASVLGVGLVPLVARIRRELLGDHQRNGRLLIDSAAETGAMSVEELLARAAQSPKTRRLFMNVVDAAIEAEEDYAVRTLGSALVSGLIATDNTVFDVNKKIVSAVRDIGEAELCLLDFIVAYEPPRLAGDTGPNKVELPDYSHSFHLEGKWNVGYRQWTRSRVQYYRPRLDPVLESLFGTLERHGLVRWDSNTEETLMKLNQALQKDASKRAVQRERGIRTAPIGRVSVPPNEPTVSPTKLGELVWLRYRDAGAEIPDVWTTPESASEASTTSHPDHQADNHS
jgi:hypothetical protein